MLRYRERCFALKTLCRDQFARIHLEPAFTSRILGQSLSRLRARPTTSSAATAPLSSPSLTDRAGCAGPQNRYGILRLGRSQLGRPGTWSVWRRLRNDYKRVSSLSWNAPAFGRHEQGSFCARSGRLGTRWGNYSGFVRIWQADRGRARLFLCLGCCCRTAGGRAASRRTEPRREGSPPRPSRPGR